MGGGDDEGAGTRGRDVDVLIDRFIPLSADGRIRGVRDLPEDLLLDVLLLMEMERTMNF